MPLRRTPILTLMARAERLLTGQSPAPRATPAQIAALELHHLSLDHNRTLAYARAGDPAAPRLIFIHGSPGDATDFADYLITPPADLEPITVDRLGFGRSITEPGRPRAPVVSLAAQAQSIAPLLVQRAGRWPILIGHSLGGPIAAYLAAQHAGRVSGLLSLAGSYDPAHETPRWYNRLLALPPLAQFAPSAITNANLEMYATQEQFTLLAPLLPRITCPVIAIHGDADPLVPIANLDYLKRTLTSAASFEAIKLPHEKHFLPWTQEPLIRQQLARF